MIIRTHCGVNVDQTLDHCVSIHQLLLIEPSFFFYFQYFVSIYQLLLIEHHSSFIFSIVLALTNGDNSYFLFYYHFDQTLKLPQNLTPFSPFAHTTLRHRLDHYASITRNPHMQMFKRRRNCITRMIRLSPNIYFLMCILDKWVHQEAYTLSLTC